MDIYIGYGFNIEDIKEEDWASLVNKYDKENYEVFREKSNGRTGYKEFAGSWHNSCSEYLAEIINASESEDAGVYGIVAGWYGNYIVFESLRFANDRGFDAQRSQHIGCQEDFIKMTGKYIPTENITFGNIYADLEWYNPSYILE